MSISFNEVPSNLRVPLFYAEFDNSNAQQGSVDQEYRSLLIGNKLSSGTKAELTIHRITSAEQAAEYFGVGSVLSDMAGKFLGINKLNPLYCVPIDDNGSGVAASGKISIVASGTLAGVIALMIGGRRIEVGVTAGMTAAQIATAMVAAIVADTNCVVTAVVDGDDNFEVNLTAKNKGVHGNEIDVSYNYASDDILPGGVTLSITAMASGAGNPDVTEAWPVIGDDQYLLISTPWTDSTNLTAVETELTERFGPLAQNDGYAVYGKRASFSSLATLGDGRNSQFTTIIECIGPSSPWQKAAAVLARVAGAASIDPARPFQTLVLTGIYAPKLSDRFTLEERNQLLYTGIATSTVNPAGQVVIERLITTFKENSFGSPDTSYLDLNTLLTLSYLRFDLKARITSKYPRHKLASDGTRYAPGQAIVTPKVIKAEIINKFKEWEENGLVEGFDQFKTDLIVERNVDNPNRLDVMMPPDLMNQFIVMGVQIKFLL